MKMKFEPVRGMHDYYGIEAEKIRFFEQTFIDVVRAAGYVEALTPIVEPFELFSIKEGEEIRNTMYTFFDKANRELALRPEITPSIVRLYVNSLQHLPKPIRVYYVGRVYRYDEPQYGRYREFRQAGVELLGSSSFLADIEVLLLVYNVYERLNVLNEITISINDINVYRELFNTFKIDETKQEHLLHLIDKKETSEVLSELKSLGINEETISLLEYLLSNKISTEEEFLKFKEEIKKYNYVNNIIKYFDNLEKYFITFKNLGYNIEIDTSLVRGLAYYTGFVFEVKHPNVNFSIGGGGRYDKLVELYGGDFTPAVGFALGVERNILALKDKIKPRIKPKVALVLLDQSFVNYAIEVLRTLHNAGAQVVLNLKDISLSKLIPQLFDEGYRLAIIIGKQEALNNKLTVRDLVTKEQQTIEKSKILDIVRQLL